MPAADLPANEAQRLQKLRDLGVLDGPAMPSLDALVQTAALVCATPISLVSLVDEDRQWFAARVGCPDLTQTPRDQAFSAHALLGDQLLEVEDLRLDPRFRDNPFVLAGPKIVFYAAVPLLLSTGEVMGTLCVMDQQPRALTADQQAVLRKLAVVAGNVLESAQSLKVQRQANALLENSSDAVVSMDLRRHVTYLNRAAERMFACRAHQVLGKTVDVLGAWSDALVHKNAAGALPIDQEVIVNLAGDGGAGAGGTEAADDLALARLIEIRDGQEVLIGHSCLIRSVGNQGALRAAHEEVRRLSLVAKNSTNLVIVTDESGHITWVNKSFELVTGFGAAEAVGQIPSQLLGLTQVASEQVAAIQAAVLEQRPFRGEMPLLIKSGQERWVDLQLQPLLGDPGEVLGYVCIATDITERRSHTRQLSEERTRLLNILDVIGAGTWEVDLVTGHTLLGERYGTMVGYEPHEVGELAKQDFFLNIHPDDRAQVQKTFADYVQGISLTYKAEFRMRHKLGHWTWIASKGGALIRDDRGRVLSYAGIHLDINEQKRAETEQRANAGRMDLATRSAGIGFWHIDVETGEVQWDEHMYVLTQIDRSVSPQEAKSEWMRRVHPEDLPAVRARMSQILKAREGDTVAGETRLLMPGGDIRYLFQSGKMVLDEQSGHLRMVGLTQDLTSLRRMEDQMLADRAVLHSAGRMAKLGGWSLKVETGESQWSLQAYSVLGANLSRKLRWKQVLDMFESRSAKTLNAAVLACASQGTSFDLELALAPALGRAKWVRVAAERLERPGRSPEIAGALQDVSETVAMRHGLERRNAEIQSILDNLPCGLSVFNERLELVYMNTEYRRMMDFPDSLFEHGRPRFEDFIRYNIRRGEYGPGDPAEQISRAVHIASDKKVHHRLERHQHNGNWIEMAGGPLPGGGFIKTATDITARKSAELDAIRSESIFRESIEALNEGFALYDPDDRLVFCNEKYRQIYAGTADLIVPGRRFEDMVRTSVQRGQHPEAKGWEEEWTRERMAQHARAQGEVVQRLADGRVVRVLERRTSDGHTVGFRVDVTELVRKTEEAQQASRYKSQFLANMSHEIRTPMNAVLGMSALLAGSGLNPRQLNYVNKLQSAARLQLALINDILDLSKIEAGKFELDPCVFAVEDLLRGLSEMLSVNLGDKPVEVVFDIDPALPAQLLGDDLRLRQILLNLSSNAIKFTSAGDVVVSVQVLAEGPDGVCMEVAVEDSGIGIAPENIERIFTGFVQAEASTTRRFGGTGLGLVISQHLLKLMNSRLEVSSEIGRGSRFSFVLTLPKPAATLTKGHSLGAGEPSMAAQAPGPRMLLVEANSRSRQIVRRMSEAMGWQVDEADSVNAAAQAQADRGAYELVVYGHHPAPVPGAENGDAAYEQLRQRLQDTDTLLVCMVNAATRHRLAMQQGQTCHMVLKPVTPGALKEAIAEARLARDGQTDEPAQVAEILAAAPSAALPLAGLNLLLVEDNLTNQEIALEMLSGAGASLTLAQNGQLAVDFLTSDLAKKVNVDAVLMDIQMPVMDGLTATRELHRLLGDTCPPIVAMTANSMVSDIEGCKAAGMVEFVGKPFELSVLINVILRVVGRAVVAPAPNFAPAPEASSREALGIDPQLAMQRLGGNASFYKRMLAQFNRDLPVVLSHLHRSVKQLDWKLATQELHTLKGLAAAMGFNDLSKAAATAELVCRQQLTTALPPANRPPLEVLLGPVFVAADEARDWVQTQSRENNAAPSPDTVTAQGTGLSQAARTDLIRLLNLLEQADMESTELVQSLEHRHGQMLGAAVHGLLRAVTELDFAAAANLCAELLKD